MTVDNNNKPKHFQSYVVSIQGARGSGKSLYLAYLGMFDLCHGQQVWSNMPLKISKSFAEAHMDTSKAGLVTTPLDWDALYSLDKGLVNGTVLIDEAQYFSDSRSSTSMKNRLLNAIVAQVRKRSLNLYYSVKVGDWVDKRLNYETDVVISCYNASYSDWGRKAGVPLGNVLRLRYYDMSGVITGRQYNKFPHPYKEVLFKRAYLVHDCYDTSQVQDIEEAFTNVQMDMRKRVITNKQRAGDILSSLHELAMELKQRHGDMIPTSQYWAVAGAMGIEGEPRAMGRYLRELGVERKQKHGGSYFYDLTNLSESPLIKVKGA